MGSAEYRELKAQMNRIEELLSRLVGEPRPEPVPVKPSPVTPEMSEAAQRKALQEEGRWVLQTQGIEAYQQFWKEQARKAKPRIRRAA